MKRAHNSTAAFTSDFDESQFYNLVKKINEDCYSTSEEIINYFKSKDIGSPEQSNLPFITSLVDDFIANIPFESQRMKNLRQDQIIEDLSFRVSFLENDNKTSLAIIDRKNIIIGELAFDNLEYHSEVEQRNRNIEELYQQVESLGEENLELQEGLDNLNRLYSKVLEDYEYDIESFRESNDEKNGLLDEINDIKVSMGQTIQSLNDSLEESEEKFGKLTLDFQLLVEKNASLAKEISLVDLDYKNKIEFKEIENLSIISVLEEDVLVKDSEIKSLDEDKNKLLEKNRQFRKRVFELESEVCKLNLSMKNLKTAVKPKVNSSTVSPVLDQICRSLKDPVLKNHGILLNNFKVDYKEGSILGYDDIKTHLTANDMCIECCRGMTYDETESVRYNRGALSDLDGVIQRCGFIHTRCLNLIKFVPLKLTRPSRNEQ